MKIKPATILYAFLLLVISCRSATEAIRPVQQQITESVYASGIVKSKDQYQVFSAVNGIVSEVLVTEGDSVKNGDALMRLINTAAQLNSENARLSSDYASVDANEEKLREARINIDLARTKMENDASLLGRQRALWQQQIGTKNEFDQRQLAYQASLNAIESARLKLANLQKQINFQAKQSQKSFQLAQSIAGDFVIRSKVYGKVHSLLKEKGEMVNMQTPVALVGNGNLFVLELQVDEYDISKIKTGQKIFLTMDSYKGQVYEAVVTKINPLMSERSKSFTIDAQFTTKPTALYPNLTCEANIVILEKQKALTIPRDYLFQDNYVMLQNKEKRKVTTGLKDYQQVEILSGLTLNDLIIKPAK